MFFQSSRVAVHGIIAIVCGNLSGLFMGFDKSFLSCGLFGYNSFLVGLAIATFDSAEIHMGYNWSALIGVVITSYFSSVLFVMLGKILAPYKVSLCPVQPMHVSTFALSHSCLTNNWQSTISNQTPPFTLPFNISTLVFLMAMKQITRNEVDQEPLVSVATTPLTATAFFAGSIRGVGQVFLANNIISGVLVLFGIMLCSRISAVAAFVGSVVGAGVASLVSDDVAAIENGLYGFNPSLTLTAMVMFYVPSLGSVSFGILASVVTVFVQLALEKTLRVWSLPFMTLPFCFAALAFVVIQGTTSNVISVPLSSMTTPEDHLTRVKKLSTGFDLLFGAIRSSSYQGELRKSWKSVVGYKKGGTTRMSSILQEYDEDIHGGEARGGIFARCKQLLKRDDHTSTRESRKQSFAQSFRLSSALKSGALRDEKTAYCRMFSYIDKNDEHEISKSQFEAFLRSVGLDDEVGLDFALEAFQLMDLDGSGDIDLEEFIAFAKISRLMPAIRRLIVKFFDFVDVNGDRAVEIAELDSARAYLSLPAISDADRDSLNALCNGDDELEFDVIVNFVTIFKLKYIIKEYQSKRGKGASLDDSLRSSVRI
jgi:urea transporter/Ca2+-binding EF-hand superfamily protein